MMDFDHICNHRSSSSVAAMVYEFATTTHLSSYYWGTEEFFLPVFPTLNQALIHSSCSDVSLIINFASHRTAPSITEQIILNHPSIKSIVIIAEGIPDRITRRLGWLARERGVTLIGPATVGGIKPGVFRIGNTGGRLENIMASKLYRPGSVGFVTKSGGLLNEINNILSIYADGTCEGIAIGGDRFPGTTLLDHLLRYEYDPSIKILLMIGESGGDLEYEVVHALEDGRLKKPLIAWVVGTCASQFKTEVSFGHAGSWAGGKAELATVKNSALANAGALVPSSFSELGHLVRQTFNMLRDNLIIIPFTEPAVPRVPMDYAWAKKLGLVRKPKGFITTISDDRGEELVYAGFPISKVLNDGMGVGGVISLLWFKRPMPDWSYKYFEILLQLTADHGPAVAGAHNTIVTARAGKDLISSLVSGLLTIGPRFGGACDDAAVQFRNAQRDEITAEVFVQTMRSENKMIMGIGHKIKSVHNMDMRVSLLKAFCKKHFPSTSTIDYALQVEAITVRKKDTLILNVDGLIGASFVDILKGSGCFSTDEADDYINMGCVNGIFVLGRSIGFIGHYLDQKRLKQGLYRHDAEDISYVLPELP